MAIKIPWFNSKGSDKVDQLNKKSLQGYFLEAGKLLKERREHYGITRRELADRTRITPSVLEAIENGLANKLPESAYLCSMLRILEIELDLERKSLDVFLLANNNPLRKTHLRNFTTRNLNILSTWQGGLIYSALMLISLFILNQQQRHLARLNSQTFEPVVTNIESVKVSEVETSNQMEINNSNKEVTSLKRHYPNWITSLIRKIQLQSEFNWLEINISQESQVSIESGYDHQSTFNKFQGNIKLKLLTPIVVKILPPLKETDAIIWKGKRYTQSKQKNGLYKFN